MMEVMWALERFTEEIHSSYIWKQHLAQEPCELTASEGKH